VIEATAKEKGATMSGVAAKIDAMAVEVSSLIHRR